MLFSSLRTLVLIGFFSAAFVLSGCSINQQFSWIDDIIEPSDDGQQESSTDPELKPEVTESEICLDRELKELALTGSWEAPQTRHPDVVATMPNIPSVSYDFPIVVNRQVEMYIELFQGELRPYFSKWLARSGRYLPLFHGELESAGLPLDLAYLSMIESGFSQRAYSRARAVGLWQFMSGTGRDFGLNVSRYVDERRDAEKSTRAAAAYLKSLYNEFDDWYLAVAAYNGGPGTIRNAIKRTGSTDFWELAQGQYLHIETKRYVPKLIAAIIIAKEPEKYGFQDIAYEMPLAYETLTVGPGLDLQAAALITGCDDSGIKQLNQELLVGKTPLDCEQYELKIPIGSRELAERNLPRLHSIATTDYKTHIVKKNDTIARICRTYNINTTTLLKVNNLKSNQLAVGSHLRIPYRTIAYRLLPEGVDPKIANRDELVLHTVRKGETISKISRQYQVPVELIVAWNGLSNAHKIVAGRQLSLYLGSDSNPTATTTTAQAKNGRRDGSVVVLAAMKKSPPQTAEQVASEQWYQVRNGDSLWAIAQRFNTSPNEIRRLNHLKSNLIHPGSRLKIVDV